MSEMIERVARALYRKDAPFVGQWQDAWEEISPQLREAFYAYARHAIEAMREPTYAMIGAGGAEEVASRCGLYSDSIGDYEAGKAYKAMIEEALK